MNQRLLLRPIKATKHVSTTTVWSSVRDIYSRLSTRLRADTLLKNPYRGSRRNAESRSQAWSESRDKGGNWWTDCHSDKFQLGKIRTVRNQWMSTVQVRKDLRTHINQAIDLSTVAIKAMEFLIIKITLPSCDLQQSMCQTSHLSPTDVTFSPHFKKACCCKISLVTIA